MTDAVFISARGAWEAAGLWGTRHNAQAVSDTLVARTLLTYAVLPKFNRGELLGYALLINGAPITDEELTELLNETS